MLGEWEAHEAAARLIFPVPTDLDLTAPTETRVTQDGFHRAAWVSNPTISHATAVVSQAPAEPKQHHAHPACFSLTVWKFRGYSGSTELMVGLDDLKGLFQP